MNLALQLTDHIILDKGTMALERILRLSMARAADALERYHIKTITSKVVVIKKSKIVVLFAMETINGRKSVQHQVAALVNGDQIWYIDL